jgi:predicted N-acetyltransferase YhbS
MPKDAVVLLDNDDDKDIDELEDEAVGMVSEARLSRALLKVDSLDGPESRPRLAKVCR